MTLISVMIAATSATAGAPVHLLSAAYGEVGSDVGLALAVDAAGNMAVVGSFQGTIDLGGGNIPTAGNLDGFVGVYDKDGAHLWSRNLGGTSTDECWAVAFDYLGNVIVAGYFRTAADFGGGSIVSNGGADIFLAKYDDAGNHMWSQGFGGTGDDFVNDVDTDAGANIAMTGRYFGSIDFGGGNLVSAGGNDAYLVKFNAAGGHSWSQRFGSTSNDEGQRVAFDELERIVVCGDFRNTVDFGGGNIASNGTADIFLAKYGITGIHIWSQGFGGTSTESAQGLDIGEDGTIALTGSFRDTVDFGGGNLVSNGSRDVFVAAYDTDGGHKFSTGFGSTSTDEGTGVAVDPDGNVYLAAWFRETLDLGGGPIGSGSEEDIALVMYTAEGAHRWSAAYGTGTAVPLGIALDDVFNTVITGYYVTSINFGGGNFPSAGSNDIFIARLGPPPEPFIASVADIGNDQGGKVKLRFERSGHDDAASATPVLGYDIYRRADTPPALAAPGRSREVPTPAGAGGWTYLATVPAHGETEYGIDVPTLADSTTAYGQFWSTFYVRAATATPTTFWDSAPDSGYSLDNIAPGAPMAPLLAAGTLAWQAPADADLDHFTVYGALVDDFAAATVVDYTTEASLDVTASPYAFYFVTATDAAGNESDPASAAAPTGVGGTPSRYVLSVGNYPNPFNPSTTVRYTVPAPGVVTVAVYDARGALVTTLVDDEVLAAGSYRARWNGRSSAGNAVSSGVYFARINHDNVTMSRKMMLLK
jgi:hypothetical protein